MFPMPDREAIEQKQKTKSIRDRSKPIFGPKPSGRTDVLPIPDRAHHADWLEAGFHDTCYTLPCRAGMYITQDNNQLWTRGSLRNMLVYTTWPMGINRRLHRAHEFPSCKWRGWSTESSTSNHKCDKQTLWLWQFSHDHALWSWSAFNVCVLFSYIYSYASTLPGQKQST